LAVPGMLGLVVILAGLAFLPLLIVGAALLVGWAIVASVAWGTASSSLLSHIGGVSPRAAATAGALEPVEAERLADLCEGLCASLGLPVPELRILADPCLNAIAIGRRHDEAAIVVTAGLVKGLDRIELEAVIAHELAHVKRLDIATTALAASGVARVVLGLGGERVRRWFEQAEREIRADLAAVATTRYPPGMISALERICAAGDSRPISLPSSVLERTSSSWLVPYDPAAGEPSMAVRFDVLREL
jgi:heat shock protein HtpX